MNISYQLQHDARGRLTFTGEDGQTHENVVPVRAFPIAAPDQGVALVDGKVVCEATMMCARSREA